MTVRGEPPYLAIVRKLRERIEAGELGPGDRVPSTRQIAAEHGVAMATATKVLTTLQRAGLVRAVPGIGTVVRSAAGPGHGSGQGQTPRESGDPRQGRDPRKGRHSLGLPQIVDCAVEIADDEGLAAVSMRRVAAALGVGVMSLYHHVPNRSELVRLMSDAVFGGATLPVPESDDWRPRLETVARTLWSTYRRHPWVAAPAMTSAAHPPLLPNAIALVEWQVRALGDLGLTDLDVIRLVTTLNSFVGGMALSNAMELESEQESGVGVEQQWAAVGAGFDELMASGRFPMLAGLVIDAPAATDIDAIFEFGLQRYLDGLAAYVSTTGRGGARAHTKE